MLLNINLLDKQKLLDNNLALIDFENKQRNNIEVIKENLNWCVYINVRFVYFCCSSVKKADAINDPGT